MATTPKNALPVPAPILDVTEDLRLAINAITQAEARVRSLEGRYGAAWLNVREVVSHLNNALEAVRFAVPYTSCPMGVNCSDRCRACRGTGFIPKAVYDALPEGMR